MFVGLIFKIFKLNNTCIKSGEDDGADGYQVQRGEYVVGVRRFTNAPGHQYYKKHHAIINFPYLFKNL